MKKLNLNNIYKLRSRCLPLPTIPSPLPSKTLSMEVWQHWLCFYPACRPPLGLKLQVSKSVRIFPCPGPKKGFESRVESTLQKSMLVPVNYDEPVKQVSHKSCSLPFPQTNTKLLLVQAPSLSPSQKTKYTILNPEPPASDGGGGGGGGGGEGRAGSAAAATTTKLDQVPEPKIVLYRRDQVLYKKVKSCQNP